MTELTIKEKIQEIARINEAAYGHVHIGFIRAFARLICEEMKIKRLEQHNWKCSRRYEDCESCRENEIADLLEQKAQEILKALE